MVSSHSESVVNPTTHGSLQQQTLPVDLSSLQDLISFSTPILVDQQVLPFQTATTLTPPIQQVVSNINVQQSLPLDTNTLQDLNSLLMLNCMNNGSATSNDDSSPLLNIPSSNMFFHE
ncbi:hypothetical protein C9374_013109 [Naegleria lovaniensis]|uniref:Uncharacterized protein n=1 Tax=Naegleria lovaniensis TaxID=51637 RepID=A0AA88KDD1_NAELO|nr:uncharacterized protein C9374_013109 [Naegleria lovaniensis]KAG2372829.1 hypothetical protein C9374_013109 [Naegleria lovaniensis]